MLFIVLGPTAVGKTALTIELAQMLGTEIISCDSRQVYQGLSIGTAAPTAEEQALVKHHLVQFLPLTEYYNVYLFEQDAIKTYTEINSKYGSALMTGGSGMYIDVVCNGIDDIPDIDQELRDSLWHRFQTEGIENLRSELKLADPLFYAQTDIKNHKRIIRGLEVFMQTGKPYSSFRTSEPKKREFPIVKIGINRPRQELYERINARVEEMFSDGLEAEASNFYQFRKLNSLNTLGYKELFAAFDGEYSVERAKELIKRNSRHYAKKQLSWFKRDSSIKWFNADEKDAVKRFVRESISG